MNSHSPDHDCTFILTVERRVETTVPAQWKRDNVELPANGVYVSTTSKQTTTFVATRR